MNAKSASCTRCVDTEDDGHIHAPDGTCCDANGFIIEQGHPQQGVLWSGCEGADPTWKPETVIAGEAPGQDEAPLGSPRLAPLIERLRTHALSDPGFWDSVPSPPLYPYSDKDIIAAQRVVGRWSCSVPNLLPSAKHRRKTINTLLEAEAAYLREAGWQSNDGELWSGGLIRNRFQVIAQRDAVAMQKAKDRRDLRSLKEETRL